MHLFEGLCKNPMVAHRVVRRAEVGDCLDQAEAAHGIVGVRHRFLRRTPNRGDPYRDRVGDNSQSDLGRRVLGKERAFPNILPDHR